MPDRDRGNRQGKKYFVHPRIPTHENHYTKKKSTEINWASPHSLEAFSLSTSWNASRNWWAWEGWKMRAGRNLMLMSPHPPKWKPETSAPVSSLPVHEGKGRGGGIWPTFIPACSYNGISCGHIRTVHSTEGASTSGIHDQLRVSILRGHSNASRECIYNPACCLTTSVVRPESSTSPLRLATANKSFSLICLTTASRVTILTRSPVQVLVIR